MLYKYNGEQFDANTGFYCLCARYMNPSTSTFISTDPTQGSIFGPISLHKYLYTNANSVMNSEPSGAVLGALFCGMGVMEVKSVQTRLLLRWTFAGLGAVSLADAIDLYLSN